MHFNTIIRCIIASYSVIYVYAAMTDNSDADLDKVRYRRMATNSFYTCSTSFKH